MATVSIGTTTWAVTLASSAAELTAGLSGVASIDVQTGMLFDMAADQDVITINMASMLFNLDIVFMNSDGHVVGVARDAVPGVNIAFDAAGGDGARYFLEMNAGEAVDVSVGDIAVIDVGEVVDSTLDINTIITPLITVMMVGMMVKMMGDTK